MQALKNHKQNRFYRLFSTTFTEIDKKTNNPDTYNKQKPNRTFTATLPLFPIEHFKLIDSFWLPKHVIAIKHSTNHLNLTATRTPNIIVTNRPVRAKTTQPSRISLDHCHGRQQQNNTTTQINNHSPRGASQNRFRVSASKMCIDSCTERVLRMAVVYVVALTAETQRSQ